MQLNLGFQNLPEPESEIWGKLDDKQKHLVTSAITRLLIKAALHDDNSAAAHIIHQSQPERNSHE